MPTISYRTKTSRPCKITGVAFCCTTVNCFKPRFFSKFAIWWLWILRSVKFFPEKTFSFMGFTCRWPITGISGLFLNKPLTFAYIDFSFTFSSFPLSFLLFGYCFLNLSFFSCLLPPSFVSFLIFFGDGSSSVFKKENWGFSPSLDILFEGLFLAKVFPSNTGLLTTSICILSSFFFDLCLFFI